MPKTKTSLKKTATMWNQGLFAKRVKKSETLQNVSGIVQGSNEPINRPLIKQGLYILFSLKHFLQCNPTSNIRSLARKVPPVWLDLITYSHVGDFYDEDWYLYSKGSRNNPEAPIMYTFNGAFNSSRTHCRHLYSIHLWGNSVNFWHL